MLKFTINEKELKEVIQKVATITPKKSVISCLQRIYFKVADGKLTVFSTDVEQILTLRNIDAWNTEDGSIGIDLEDCKLLEKFKSTVTFEDVEIVKDNIHTLKVTSGKKTLKFNAYDTEAELPTIEPGKTLKTALTVSQAWLYDTFITLERYTGDNANNKLMLAYSINTQSERVEALDGYRIGCRTIPTDMITDNTENIVVHKMLVPTMKKVLDKKSEEAIMVTYTENTINVEAVDFIYTQRRLHGEYFNIGNMLTDISDFSFIGNRAEVLEVLKYDVDLKKKVGSDKPLIMFKGTDGIGFYYFNNKMEAVDTLETKETRFSEDLMIGFNPEYLKDVMETIDTEDPLFRGSSPKSPMMIDGNEYKFLVLPVNIVNVEIDKIKNHLAA